MAFTRPLEVNGKPVGGGGEPLVCAPLVGRDEGAVLGELDAIVAKRPDLLEWRVDFFSGIADSGRVVELAREIRKRAGGIPIIFTRRSIREGGETIGISEDEVLAMYQAVARSGAVDFIDCELSSEPRHFAAAVELARETGTKLIASFHNFQKTPSAEEIVATFVSMEKAGADVAKVAVMPQGLEDVLTVLQATLQGQKAISLPIISMSMGTYGSLSRLFGWVFGSSVSFAVGQKASAPGQVPIEDLRKVLEVLQRSLKP
ncbi:type I 3-dehydroquinate dehydratase [Aromatoleum toluvorans]|uniref:3-dehydroquinate dehydratase n=1 Tax=Aromatoleum toluvorans TaxID=92002 RepID=A0ABX1Q255_9RHOO|nr:type I 3-dehydroquinate dehydratase [Aromatoleum toluvorans]NMG44436.1 type I 3-dehydroquinate dehydratase [Aromatoleum toluvorans]